jgi:hypothetical protein
MADSAGPIRSVDTEQTCRATCRKVVRALARTPAGRSSAGSTRARVWMRRRRRGKPVAQRQRGTRLTGVRHRAHNVMPPTARGRFIQRRTRGTEGGPGGCRSCRAIQMPLDVSSIFAWQLSHSDRQRYPIGANRLGQSPPSGKRPPRAPRPGLRRAAHPRRAPPRRTGCAIPQRTDRLPPRSR